MIHSPGHGIHDPAEDQSDSDEGAEDLGAVDQPFAGSVFAEDTKDYGDQEGKQHHGVEV
jgi:hypothetical protein